MKSFCLMLFRLCLAAWVGMATFFVAVLVGLRNSQLFDDQTLLNHPKVLFPLYYSFEFWLLGAALCCGIVARTSASAWNSKHHACLVVLAAALLIAVVDYAAIYRPLAAMIELPTLPPEFALYHRLSRWINIAGLILSAAAATLALWPPNSHAHHHSEPPG